MGRSRHDFIIDDHPKKFHRIDLLDSRLRVDAGYALQRRIHDYLLDKGLEHGGWKVGATSDATLEKVGLTKAFYAPLYSETFSSETTKGSGHHNPISISGMNVRGIEAEYAYEFNHRPKSLDVADVKEALRCVRPVVEVCAGRFDVPPSGAMLIADCGGNGGVVLGNSTFEASEDVKHETVTTFIDEVQVAVGKGSEVLGDPFSSLMFVLGELDSEESEYSLDDVKPGHLVLTGACSGLFPITKPCRVSVEFQGRGVVQFEFVE